LPRQTPRNSRKLQFPVGKHFDQVDALGLIGQVLAKLLVGKETRCQTPSTLFPISLSRPRSGNKNIATETEWLSRVNGSVLNEHFLVVIRLLVNKLLKIPNARIVRDTSRCRRLKPPTTEVVPREMTITRANVMN
jgi:hypothetical protein